MRFGARFRELEAEERRVGGACFVQRVALDRRLRDQGLGRRIELHEAKRTARALLQSQGLVPWKRTKYVSHLAIRRVGWKSFDVECRARICGNLGRQAKLQVGGAR